MEQIDYDHVTVDGRTLELLAAGPTGGLTFVLHGGTPVAAAPFAPAIEAVTALGIRYVTYSRPGYAGSDPRPGRTVADAAADVTAILDHLGAGDFVTAGWSGGGPHALACAALLPERCRAAATIAGVAPYPAEGLDWLAGMGEENHEEFGAAVQGAEALTTWLGPAAADLADVTAEDVAAALGDLVTEVDRAALHGPFADWQATEFRRAVSSGIAGWRDDDLAFVAPWGFDLAAITRPVFVWQGGQDRMVPFAHGQWLAAHVAGAVAHLLPDEGHLSIGVDSFGSIVAELAAAAG